MEKRRRFRTESLFTAAFRVMALRRLVVPLLLRFWQAPGTGLHGNGDAHAAAPDGHVGDVRPLVFVRAVTLDGVQEALLVETSCKHADVWNEDLDLDPSIRTNGSTPGGAVNVLPAPLLATAAISE